MKCIELQSGAINWLSEDRIEDARLAQAERWLYWFLCRRREYGGASTWAWATYHSRRDPARGPTALGAVNWAVANGLRVRVDPAPFAVR